MSIICHEGRYKSGHKALCRQSEQLELLGMQRPVGPTAQEGSNQRLWSPSSARFWSWLDVSHSVPVHLTATSLAVLSVDRPGHSHVENPPPFPSSSPPTAILLPSAGSQLPPHTYRSPSNSGFLRGLGHRVFLPNELRPRTFPAGPHVLR